ncbi:MAG: hypothetical protein PHE53_07410 [Thermoguttaceae bacterium]|nr:hypothetical protein [Thermoguttaceae bacterium]
MRKMIGIIHAIAVKLLIGTVLVASSTVPAAEAPQPSDAAVLQEFENPGARFRGKPFWSWNGELREDELLRQIDVIHEMGFGGFFMHSRTGLATEYLGDEWFRLTNACIEHAKQLGMEAWLYDEDRWPSGTAGGEVSRNPEYRMHYMRCTPVSGADFDWKKTASENDGSQTANRRSTLVAAFAVELDGVNFSHSERLTDASPKTDYETKTVLVFTVEEMSESSFYNGSTYIDTMSPEPTQEFIRLTHEQYKKNCGTEMGQTLQGIFTDEPHRGAIMSNFGGGAGNPEWMLPWSKTIAPYMEKRFHMDVMANLPELFLKKDGNKISPMKWAYMETTQSLFLDCYMKPIYDWCEQNHMKYTGHVLHEDSLTTQAVMQGSLMRSYEYMHHPGIDVLSQGNRGYWIAKQLQSAARQLGKTDLLSELYGCTGWQMTMADYRECGDWQALFGINVRCPHLSWYTMLGQAKRDYPASIFYQSPWYQDWAQLETFYARLHTILATGKPVCDTLVINPVESLWAQFYPGWCHGLGTADGDIAALESAYNSLFMQLQGAQIDFDYGDEDFLQRLGRVERDADENAVLYIGEQAYRTVIIPPMTTMRSSTLKLLQEFAEANGRIVFVGDVPKYVDAVESSEPTLLAAQQTAKRNIQKVSLDTAAPAAKRVDGKLPSSGVMIACNKSKDIFIQIRQDGTTRYVVMMNFGAEPFDTTVEGNACLFSPEHVRFLEKWDCMTGERTLVPFHSVLMNGPDGTNDSDSEKDPADAIQIEHLVLQPGECVVYRLAETLSSDDLPAEPMTSSSQTRASDELPQIAVEGPFDYTLSEPNALILDYVTAEITDGVDAAKPKVVESLKDRTYEVLKADQRIRDAFGLAHRGGEMLQPWYQKKIGMSESFVGAVKLTYTLHIDPSLSKIPSTELALEEPQKLTSLTINDQTIDLAKFDPKRTWCDNAFQKISLDTELLHTGENTITLEMRYSPSSNIEAIYLLGDFGVRLDAAPESSGVAQWAVMTELPKQLAVGDIVSQGLPFYGARIMYKVPLDQTFHSSSLNVKVRSSAAITHLFRKGCPAVTVGWTPSPDGWLAVLAPTSDATDETVGDCVEIETVLTRRNTFGPLHQMPKRAPNYGPDNWTTGTPGHDWSDEYQLLPYGLLDAPLLSK